MVSGRHKSRTFRKVFRKAPGNRNVTHYKKRKPKAASCANCKAKLTGVLRERTYKMVNIAKTKKRPERKYGGYLCSKCTREKIIQEARK